MSEITSLEYKSEAKVSSSQLRKLEGNTIGILKVYPPYRHGYEEATRKFRSFYNFPARLTAEVIYSWDPEAKVKEGDTFVLREKFWDDESKKFGFKKVTTFKGFNQLFPKVFDMDITIKDKATFEVYDSSIKERVNAEMGRGNTFTLQAVGASKIRAMMETFDIERSIPLVDKKDRLTWETVKGLPYDWEDGKLGELAGKFISFKVKGEKIETRYTFKEATPFDPTEKLEGVTIEDCPF